MNTALKLINIIEKDGLARSPSLSEDAALQLREMILLGQLPPGTQLPERDLAQALGVRSKTAAITAARFASSPTVAAIPARCLRALWLNRSSGWWDAATMRSF